MTDEISTDEEFTDRSLRLIEEDAAPPVPEQIAKATTLAGDAFLRVDAVAETTNDIGLAKLTVAEPQQEKGSGSMFAFAKPLAALVTAAAVFIVAWFAPTGASADTTFGSVLDEALQSKNLQLEVTVKGRQAEVLVSGTSVRWQDSEKQYRIAAGTRLWKIDEEQNTVADGSNPWLDSGRKNVDLVALLGDSASSELRAVKASAQKEHAGVLCNVFVYRPKRKNSGYIVRAFADAKTNQLYSIACWPRGVDPGTSAPVSELRLVKRNIDFDESKFIVGANLSQDGRIGTIRDVQGTVQLRPKANRRWTLVTGAMIVRTGDWIRADVRGANAVSVLLKSRYRLILGPGSLLEMTSADSAILHRGEVNITGSSKAEADFQLTARADQELTVSRGNRAHVLLNQDLKLISLKQKPVWLAGFDGTSNNESIGSLIAKVEGRDVPLTVGVHKVNVEIRDQIARTTIEESFINRTHSQLEGVFHFPLPQDASISGFGMWINGELVEADVVEKQRAREIYETILRERRDPGLLEWAGGNIFKARVFPILPHSEKRIKIVYTQVLPMRANRYRYSYALRSEMLQKTPLRELSLNVLVNSALPLKNVSCPTHSVRSDLTQHSASLEFAAQEYTPTRDFEVVCEVDSQESDVVVVPHRRGDDGYFLAQITPPSPVGNWQRDILPDGRSLNVLLVCDTSGSMDSRNRKLQADFVSAVLTSLGEQDEFNVAYCDVDTRWLHPDPKNADEENCTNAVDWLTKRRSLGWTDLDRMVKSVKGRVQNGRRQSSRADSVPEKERGQDRDSTAMTHVVYIGDGIVTAGDVNPQAFMNRVRRLTKDVSGITFHAVSTGSSFESGVLKSIAAIGGGSVRHIDGEQTPQRTAHELLNEMAQPGLRDIKVEFNGIKVAAVYPDELPNLAAGTQQILVGRYLPTGQTQNGEIVITGNRNGQPVRYTSRITVKDAEKSNSFIPRLWARAHMDHLLEQGKSDFIKEQVVALSEEFHIMTPYTSLLVLETDADRERFGVKRRFLMRDGEQFFADGRSNANFELLQQQMKAAGNWRLELRRQVLAGLTGLGRNPHLFQQSNDYGGRWSGSAMQYRYAGGGAGGGFGGSWFSGEDRGRMMPVSGVGVDRQITAGLKTADDLSAFDAEIESELDEAGDLLREDFDGVEMDSKFQLSTRSDSSVKGKRLSQSRQQMAQSPFEGAPFSRSLEVNGVMDLRKVVQKSEQSLLDGISYLGAERGAQSLRGMAYGSGYGSSSQYTAWLNELFPVVPAVSKPADSIVPQWPDEAKRIADSLLQKVSLPDDDGIRIVLTREFFNARWKHLTTRTISTQLYNSNRWLTAADSENSQRLLHWTNEKTRGSVSRAYQLGRTRDSVATDFTSFEPGSRPWSHLSLAQAYSAWHVTAGEDADGNTVLNLKSPDEANPQTVRATIDTKRSVLLRVHVSTNDQQNSDTVFRDYVKVADCWWPGKIEYRDEKNRLTSQVSQQVESLAAAEFGQAYQKALPNSSTILLPEPLPKLSAARIADEGATAGIEDYIVLLLESCRIQDWDAALTFLKKAEQQAEGKPGMQWVRQRILTAARKNEPTRQLLSVMLKDLAAKPSPADLFLAIQCVSQAGQIVDRNELLQLLDFARPVFDRQPEHVRGLLTWKNHRASALSQLGRVDESLALYKDLAEASPWDANAQATYAQQLANSGEHQQATDWLRKQLNLDAERTVYELRTLRTTYAELLRSNFMTNELVPFLKEWIDTEPDDRTAYDQYLASLMLANQTDLAETTAAEWLRLGQQEQKLKSHQLEKLNSAVEFVTGNVYRQHQNWMDPKWRKPLHDVAMFLLTHEHHIDVLQRIVSHYRFSSTDEANAVRIRGAHILKETAAEMPVERLLYFVNWSVAQEALETEDLEQITATLRRRWDDEDDQNRQQQLGAALLRLYSRTSPDEHHLAFMREQITRSAEFEDASLTAGYSLALFQSLTTREWKEAHELEAFSLLMDLTPVDSDSGFLTTPLSSLLQLVDAMIRNRVAAAESKLQSDGHPENLTRQELTKKRGEFRVAAQKALAARLKEQREKLKGNYPTADGQMTADVLRSWMQIERMHLDVQIADHSKSRILADVVKECWQILGDAPVDITDTIKDPENDAVDINPIVIRHLLRRRAFTLLCNLSLRRSAPKQLSNKVLEYIGKGMQLNDDVAKSWRSERIAMLIALDQPELLEKNLRTWIRDEDYTAPLQLMLSRLLAEQGKINDAIQFMETVQRNVPLTPSDHAALADWYLVADRKDDNRNARVDVLKSMEEWRLQNWINQQRQPWTQTDLPLPSELDEEVLFAFQALFAKSNSPGNYVYMLRSFYTACRDFRLLRMVPDSVTGRTPQQVYSFLSQLQSNLLVELRNEATADQIMERLREIRGDSKSAIDQRALDLLEAIVERRSAKVLNQPGPHVAAALAALKRAFEHDLADGEVPQLATFLTSMGKIDHRPLAEERLRQLRALQAMTNVGTDEHFKVTWQLASVLYHSHGKKQEAISQMEIAVREFKRVHPGGLPNHLNTEFEGFVRFLEYERLFAQAENYLLEELKKPANVAQQYWALQRLNSCYHNAFTRDGQVSLGSGEALYRNLLERLLQEVKRPRDNYRYQVFVLINSFFRTSKQKKIGDYRRDLKSYAFEQFPMLLQNQISNYRNVVSNLSHTVKELIGRHEALEFLVTQVENYPDRLRFTWENAWQQFAYQMGELRQNTPNVADLEPRLLKIVLKELRRDLSSGNQRNRAMMDIDGSYFWEAKADDFAKVANDVAAQHANSGQTITHVARYLFFDLRRHNRSIEILLNAWDRKILNASQQMTLVDMLHRRTRHGESIPILQPLVCEFPDQMNYRTHLIIAYSFSKRPEQREELFTNTEAHFRESRLWSEGNAAALARCCLTCKMFDHSARLYGEVIPMHQRSAPNQGIGNNTLSEYYRFQATAYSGLGKTVEAIDAAAAGVVAWGRRYAQRTSSVHALQQIIGDAKDLDDYVKYMDRQAKKNGTDSFLIRKKVGIVYASRAEHEKAIDQLQIAADLQPHDSETHEALIKSYDVLKDSESAVRQMLVQLDYDRHNLELYKEVAKRLADDEALAERALTSLVESAPLEASHHKALAELREGQDRWAAAILHWQHVARLRSLEPDGLIHLAEAQIHEKQWDDASTTLQKLSKTEWPSRFNTVPNEIRRLQNLMP